MDPNGQIFTAREALLFNSNEPHGGSVLKLVLCKRRSCHWGALFASGSDRGKLVLCLARTCAARSSLSVCSGLVQFMLHLENRVFVGRVLLGALLRAGGILGVPDHSHGVAVWQNQLINSQVINEVVTVE